MIFQPDLNWENRVDQRKSVQLTAFSKPDRACGVLEHRFAVVLAVLIFFLILLGGIVHNTGSSLACPDWPTCYGTLMPEMKGGVAIEHSHRLAAASVGLLTIVLSILLYKKR